jgi:hypothetical protein
VTRSAQEIAADLRCELPRPLITWGGIHALNLEAANMLDRLQATLTAISDLHHPTPLDVLQAGCGPEGDCEHDDSNECHAAGFTAQVCAFCWAVLCDLDDELAADRWEEAKHPCKTRQLLDKET